MVNDKKVKRITTRAAALMLRDAGFDCTEDKITRWCRTEVLKRAKKVGGQWYVDESEIREMLQ
jgi:hypothetical protein